MKLGCCRRPFPLHSLHCFQLAKSQLKAALVRVHISKRNGENELHVKICSSKTDHGQNYAILVVQKQSLSDICPIQLLQSYFHLRFRDQLCQRRAFPPLFLLCAYDISVLQNFNMFTPLLPSFSYGTLFMTEVDKNHALGSTPVNSECNYFNDSRRQVPKTISDFILTPYYKCEIMIIALSP